MQRRNFIKNAILATGALSLTAKDITALAGQPYTLRSAPATGYKKSIMWGTVGIKGSVLEKCQAIKEAGYNGIEPNSHMDRQEVLDAMKATGLVASSVCCSTHWQNPLSDPDPTIRKTGVEGAIVAMEDAKAYGTDAILLVPGTVNDKVSYADCWKRSTEEIRKLIPIAKKLKVKICIENVWNNFLLSPMEARNYVDQFKSEYVRFYFDCGNILVYGWPEQWIEILGDRIGRIHIKEFSNAKANKEGKWAGFSAPLTDGDVNWAKVMEAARKYYKSEWLTTEQGPAGTLEQLKELSSRFDKILRL